MPKLRSRHYLPCRSRGRGLQFPADCARRKGESGREFRRRPSLGARDATSASTMGYEARTDVRRPGISVVLARTARSLAAGPMAQSGRGAGVRRLVKRNDLGHGLAADRTHPRLVGRGLGPSRRVLGGFGLEFASRVDATGRTAKKSAARRVVPGSTTGLPARALD